MSYTHMQIHKNFEQLVLTSRSSGGTVIRLSCGFDVLSLAPQPNHTVVKDLNGIEWRLSPTRVIYELHPVLNSAFDKTRHVDPQPLNCELIIEENNKQQPHIHTQSQKPAKPESSLSHKPEKPSHT